MSTSAIIPICIVLLGVMSSCASGGRIASLREDGVTFSLGIPGGEEPVVMGGESSHSAQDTLLVTDHSGNEVIIMKAVRDENGEMVATDVIDAAVVTARFRNVAERHGRVTLNFRIRVPRFMLDSRWQMRIRPELVVADRVVALDSIVVSGADYRKAQLKGYQQYERFLRSIITDSTKLVDVRQLEIFLRRNIPAIYAYRYDSTEVSDVAFYSHYGVSEQASVEHYVRRLRQRLNNRRKSRIGNMYSRLVKSPILTEGIRLDTVLRQGTEDFVYDYEQTIPVSSGLRKASVVLSGDIMEEGRAVYSVPETPPLTFYISSVASFVDESERYIDEVTERRVSANTACYVEFAQGSSMVNDTLGYNAVEIGRIKDNLRSLLENESYDMDSIVVTAFSSPEGSYFTNRRLAERRSRSIASYFRAFMAEVGDSLRRDSGVIIDSGGEVSAYVMPEIEMVTRSEPENWRMLDALVLADDGLTEEDKEAYCRLSTVGDPDLRERQMRSLPSYSHIRSALYPRTRIVSFEFCMHRRGMVKDTIHTTRPDTVYRSGVQAIKDRDYERALVVLRPYHDFNTAVALCALDYDHSAMQILASLPDTPDVLYMKAILYARFGEENKAVQCYMDACALDPSLVHRGNLDPEISGLVRQYKLNQYLEQ